jgi:hypothetical protein
MSIEIIPTTASIYFIASSSIDNIAYGELVTGSICYIGTAHENNVWQTEDVDLYVQELSPYGLDLGGKTCFSGSVLDFYNTSSYGYIISSAFNPCIQLQRCNSYSINIDATGYPFYIKQSDGNGSYIPYTNGVTNNGTDNGTITFYVPYDAPDSLIYENDSNPGMFGNIVISGSGEECMPSPSPFPTPSTTPTVTPSLTPSVSPSAGSVRVHVLGDPDVATVASTISSHLSGRGYTANVTSQVLGTAYTGADLSTSLYDVVVMYTNGGHTGATTLSSNISAFQSAGGHFVAATFLWNVYAAGFDFGLTPWVGGVGQTSSAGTMDNIVAHPITIGVNPTLSAGSLFMNTVTTLQSGGTLLASYQSGQKCLAIRTVGSSNQVGINAFLNGIQSLPNLQQLVGNSILWTVGLI